jgi:hypothetical protein
VAPEKERLDTAAARRLQILVEKLTGKKMQTIVFFYTDGSVC